MPIAPQSEAELRERLVAHVNNVHTRGGRLSRLVMPELVSSSLEEQSITAAFTAGPALRDEDGHMAPGLVAALFDNTLGMLSLAQMGDGTFTPTVDLHMEFCRPVPLETPLVLHVRRECQTDRFVRLQGRLCLADSPAEPLATASGSFFIAHP